MGDTYEKALKGYYKWQIVSGRNHWSGHGIILEKMIYWLQANRKCKDGKITKYSLQNNV